LGGLVVLFRVLGPLEVSAGEGWTSVSAPKWRALLAVLLTEPGRVVSAECLVGELWGEEPPQGARKLVSGYVSRLRRLIDDQDGRVLVTRAPGYMARVTRADVDANTFEDLAGAGRRALEAQHTEQAEELLGNALALWRGAAFADVPLGPLTAAAAGRLEELRLTAVELRIEADLARGRTTDLVPELRQLTARHPLRERLWHQLMRVLQDCGRLAEALEVYTRAREVIASELGTDPGPELQYLYQRILAGGMATAGQAAGATPTATAATASLSAVPRQLPPAVSHFTGRREELRTLDGLLGGVPGPAGTVVISAIGGTAGVGKTTLALQWAHQVASRFRDGQLYVNLRGFAPATVPLTPAGAIRGFLDALGVAAHRIPADPDAQVGLYRSLLAGKQMLIVLDNARDEEQVRPLLPASHGCLVIVTSRSQLVGLAAAEVARLLTLDVLSHTEALRMLRARLGKRADSEPEAVDRIARMCGHLPLALAIAAACAAARPHLPLADLAPISGNTHDLLDVLETGDPVVNVRAVFSWSVQQLDLETAQMFRLLGLHPGPDFTAPAAASLAGIARSAAGRALRELTAASLLTEQSPGRYAFHDLVRAYAEEQAEANSHGEARRAATSRILGHYLHTARAAAMLLNPTREQASLAPPQQGVTPEILDGRQQALAWFEAEHQVLLSAIGLAARTGFDAYAWQLPWAMADYLHRRGRWHELAAIERIGLAAATRLGDLAGQAAIRRRLGITCTWLGDYPQASGHLTGSLQLYGQLGDRAGQALVHADFCHLAEYQGRPAEALAHAEQSLGHSQASGNKSGQADALGNMGWYRALLGDYLGARDTLRQSLAIGRELDFPYRQAAPWDSLGYAEHHLGNLSEAAACYQQSLRLFREYGDRYLEAVILDHLGDNFHAAAEHRQARAAWQQALDIFEDMHHPDAGKLRHKLH
jgi:DNA-binding SARP family transcriptional activator